MSLLNPLALLWILPTAGLIVLMYILRLRRRDVVVPSTLLWKQAIRDVQANAPFQKLRRSLLLLLQLLAALLLVAAAARPSLRGRGEGGRSIVAVVDVSASMAATDVRPSRLEEARSQALRLVDSLGPHDQMLVIAAGIRPAAVSGFTAEKADLRRALASLRAQETGSGMREALSLAGALVAPREAARIDVFTDGGFPPVEGVNLGRARVHVHQVGRGGGNVGIAALDYRPGLAGSGMGQVFLTLRSFDARPRAVTVEVRAGDRLLDARELVLPPGGEASDLFELPEPAQPTALKVSLEPEDSLAADNEGVLVISPRRPLRVLLVTRGNLFLESGLRADPRVELSRTSLAGFTSPAGWDVVVFDGEAPRQLPEGAYLFVDCAGDRAPAVPERVVEDAALVDADRSHPILRHVDFGRTRFTTLRTGRPRPWGRELAAGEAGPVLVAGESGRTRALWAGFRLDAAHSGFPLTAGYPIFLSSAVAWLARAEDLAGAQVRTGAPVMLDPPQGVRSVTVTRPDGSRRTLSVPERGPLAFGETELAGLYTAEAPGWRRQFAANLVDEGESDIRPRRELGLGGEGNEPASRRVIVTTELWPWLAGILVLLLAFEWHAFHRRTHLG